MVCIGTVLTQGWPSLVCQACTKLGPVSTSALAQAWLAIWAQAGSQDWANLGPALVCCLGLLICSFMHIDQIQEIPGAAHFLILALSSGIVCHFLSAMLRLSNVKPQLKVHLFSSYFQLCLDPSSSGGV